MKPFTLTERDQALYDILRRRAEPRAVTPTQPELAAQMAETGRRSARNVWDAIQRLARHGLVETVNGAHPSLMTYRVLVGGVWKTTMSRAEAKERAAIAAMGAAVGDRQGWPVPTKASARAYDRAVMRRLFAKHERRPPPKDAPRVHAPVPAAVERRSFVGCSAAMAVAG